MPKRRVFRHSTIEGATTSALSPEPRPDATLGLNGQAGTRHAHASRTPHARTRTRCPFAQTDPRPICTASLYLRGKNSQIPLPVAVAQITWKIYRSCIQSC
jgi:hypothetical protein